MYSIEEVFRERLVRYRYYLVFGFSLVFFFDVYRDFRFSIFKVVYFLCFFICDFLFWLIVLKFWLIISFIVLIYILVLFFFELFVIFILFIILLGCFFILYIWKIISIL